jgi:Ferritin-like domain
MKSLSILALLAGYAASHPHARRSGGYDDFSILAYAQTLEHLEDTFYRQGLANFTRQNFLDAGFADPFYQNLVKVAKDEEAHVQFLASAIQGENALREKSLFSLHC